MVHILAVNSSLSGDGSVSRLLVEDALQELQQFHPGATVTHRNVGLEPIPHLTPDTLLGVRGVPATAAERATSDLSDRLIGEVQAADVIVIGSPMYNFSIPTGLRSWFDHVIRPRVTFGYSEGGVQGFITGKRVIVVQSRGGLYTEGESAHMDFQEPYLRTLLGFIGLTDITFVHAERIGFGPEAREAAIAGARAQIAAAVARPVSVAA